ncbi:MAG TPA: hypothetical protein VN648_27560, partial [Candidatus Methylomirabilis sp.]|nr:hypothetical protein [Candidatus Methylomirabilis sp.]
GQNVGSYPAALPCRAGQGKRPGSHLRLTALCAVQVKDEAPPGPILSARQGFLSARGFPGPA